MRKRATGKQMIQKDISQDPEVYISNFLRLCLSYVIIILQIESLLRMRHGISNFLGETEITKWVAMQEVHVIECRVLQQRSPTQEMVRLHLPQGSPQKTIVKRRYVQWLAFNSILLRVQPCFNIHPKMSFDYKPQWASLP